MVGTQFPAYDPIAGTPTPGFERWVHHQGRGSFKLRWLYNGSGGAHARGTVHKVVYDGDEETNPKVVACTNTANLYQEVAVAYEAAGGGSSIADATFGWYVVQGYVEAFVEGTTDVAKDDFLQVAVGTDADAFIGNTSARTTGSFGIACEAQAANSAVLTDIYLFGERAIIAA